MKKEYLPALSFCFLFGVFLTLLKFFPQNVFSAAGHVVISEIQIGGSIASDEFVELYNPTSQSVDLTGWKLTKKISSGNQSSLVTAISGTIPSYGFFLLAHPNYNYTITPPDQLYSSSSYAITSDNTVLLYSDNEITLVDKVGMGDAFDFEGNQTVLPLDDRSIERKANANSTAASLSANGSEEFAGNGEDTDNNLNDFVLQETPHPQNRFSPTEVPQSVNLSPTVTPTETPTVTPTLTTTPTITPTTTSTPTITVTPTKEVTTPTTTITPTITQTPTPTVTPTVSPTITPTTTPVIQPIETPTLTPTPTVSIPEPTPYDIVFGNYLKCQINFRKIENRFFTFFIPYIRCFREKISLENNLLYN